MTLVRTEDLIGPIPEPEDQYKPDHTAAAKWEFRKAFDAHRRSQERDA